MSSNNNNEIKSIEDWTVEDVGNWLINAGYGKYKELFFENDIDGQVLVELNEFHLKTELNIKSLGERIKLYKLIKGLKSNNINNQNIKSENPKDFKSEIQNEIHNSKIINNNSENNNVNNIPTNINESYIKNKFKANSNNKTNSNNLINSINIKQDKSQLNKTKGKTTEIKENSSLLEYRIKPLKFSKKVYQKLFLPKNGIKNSYLLPEHYSLNEIPSFYYYSKIKLNKSMYSRFIQKMIFRMLRNRVTYINNQKSDHPSYVWKPFGNKFEVYYLFEKSDNEWKVIENASLKQNSNKNNYEISTLIENVKKKSNQNEQKIIHGLGYKTIPIGGYMCSKSHPQNCNEYVKEDEILPLYGDSDYSDYITDSEVENELYELEQKNNIKLKENQKITENENKNYTNDKLNTINKDKLEGDVDIFDTYEDILIDENDKENSEELKTKEFTSLNNKQYYSNYISSDLNMQNKREGLNIDEIDRIIKECIENYRIDWEKKYLDKYNKKLDYYYNMKDEYQGVENEYNDITCKRIPSLIDTIKLHEFKTEQSLLRCCGILQESVYTQCRLKFLLDLFKQPEEYIQMKIQNESEKSNEIININNEKNEKSSNKTNKSFTYEKEDWSDFIVNDEEEYLTSENLVENKYELNNSEDVSLDMKSLNKAVSDSRMMENIELESSKIIPIESTKNLNEIEIKDNDKIYDNLKDLNSVKNNEDLQNNKNDINNSISNEDNSNESIIIDEENENNNYTNDTELNNLLNIFNNEILSYAENLENLDINLINDIELNDDDKNQQKKNENVIDINTGTTLKNENKWIEYEAGETQEEKQNRIVIIDSDSDDEDDNNIKAKESYQTDLRNINKSINEEGLHIHPPNFKIKSYNKEESMFERIKELSNLVPILVQSISQDPENQKHFPEELKIFYHNFLIYLSNKKEQPNNHFSMFKFTDESLKDFMKSSYFSIKYICMRENDKITKRKLKNTTESLNKKMKLNGEEEEDSSDNNVENSSKGKSNKSKYIRIVGDDEIEETILSDKVKYRKINDISFNSENNIINIGHSDDEPDIYIDNAFNCLKDHQIEGIRFLWNNIIGYKRGCIFAHAMGLGKTLQIISFLVTLKQTHLKKAIKIPKILSAGRIMIIVPASLLKNWEEEFIKWMPEDNPDILGHIYTIQDVLKRLNTLKKWYDEGGILLISYSNYRYCLSIKNDNNLSQLYKFYFQNPGPSIIIADEGHNIKNRESAISIMLKKSKTPYRIALTGTPLQNNLEEYWCMIDFVIPGIIGDINYFRSNYSHPIENGMHRDSSKLDRTLASSTMKVLTEYLKPFVLRKDESVLFRYLPPKTEFVFSITLSDFQYDLYTSYLKIHVFGNGEVLIHQARIISILNHPIIFKRLIVNHIKELRNIRSKIYKDNNKLLPLPENKYFADEDNEVKEINDEESKTDIENSTNEDCIINTEETIETDEELIQSSNFHWVNSIFTKYEDVDNIKYSQKMKILKKIIEFCKENQSKVLIFTEYVFTFDYIHQNILKNMNIKYKILDSKVPSSKRQEIINEFNDNNEYTVFLATIRVSGLGYNLITANRVVLLDMGWNPTLDNQAISRTYRYGQKKPVFVYRFHGFQTLEESLFKTNIKKVILSKRTIDIKKAENYFDKQELKHYFTIPEKNPERMIGIPLPSKDPLLNLLIETFNKEIVNATLYHSKFDEDTFEDADPIQVNQLKMKQKLQEKNNRNSIEAVDQNLNNDINVVTESSSNNIDVDNNMNIEYQQQQQQQNIVDITKDSEEKVDQLVNRSILINEEISQTQETIQDLTISKPEINHLVQDKLPQIQKQPSLSIQDSLQQQNTQETDTQNKINTVINQNIIQQSAPTEQEILHQKSGLIQTTNQLSSQTTTPIVQYKSVIQSIPSKKPSSQHKNLIQNNESLSNDKQLQESISLKSHVSKDIQNKEQIVKPKQYQNPILIKMPKQYQYSFPVEDPKPIQEPTSIQLPTSNKNQNLTNELELNNKGPLLSNKPTNKLQNRDINKPNTISNKLQKQDSAFTKSNIQKRKFSDDTQKKIINLSSTQNHVNDKNINSSKENDQSSILSHSSNIRSENRKKRKHSHKHKSKKDHKSSKNLQGDNAILDKDTFLKSSNKIDEKNMNAMNKKQNEHKKINNQAQNNIIDKHSKSKRKEDSFTNYKDIMIIDSDNESSIPYEKTLISHKRKDSIDSIDFPAASEELKRQTSISSNKETPQFNKNKLPPISLTSEDDSTPNVSPNKYKNYQNKNSFKMNKSPSGKLSSVSNSSKSTNKNSYSSNKIDFNFMNSGSPKAKSSTPSLAKTTPTKHKQSQAHKSKSNTPKRIRNTIIIDDKEPSHFNSINHDEVTIPQPKSNENNRSFSSTSSKSVFSSVIDLDINKPSTKKKLSRSNSLNFPSSSIPSQIITGNDNKSSKTSTTSSSSFIERLKKLNKMN